VVLKVLGIKGDVLRSIPVLSIKVRSGIPFVLAMRKIVLYSFCLFLEVTVTDVFWLREIGHMPFFILRCDWE
jgi:hypothetical protein